MKTMEIAKHLKAIEGIPLSTAIKFVKLNKDRAIDLTNKVCPLSLKEAYIDLYRENREDEVFVCTLNEVRVRIYRDKDSLLIQGETETSLLITLRKDNSLKSTTMWTPKE
jgi:hypothetical protein